MWSAIPIKITVDVYGHLVPGGNKAAVDRLDGLEAVAVRNPDATSSVNAVSDDPATSENSEETRTTHRG